MAQPPKNKPKTGQNQAGKPSAEQKPQGDSYFDEFFANPQPHQLDDEPDPEQQRQWMSDHLMWETTLGMREDETIDRAIGPKDTAAQQTSQQPAPAPKRQLSEQERQLLRSEFVDNTPAPTEPEKIAPEQPRGMPPAAHNQTAARRGAPAAQNPVRKAPAGQQRSAPQAGSATSSKAPIKKVPLRRAAQRQPQTSSGATQPHASTQSRQTNSTNSTVPQRSAASSTAPPHTHTQPVSKGVVREADLSLVEDFQDEIRQEGVREKLFKFGEKAISVLSIAVISFFIGYYIGGKNATESAGTDKPAASEVAKNYKFKTTPKKPKAKRPQPKRAAPQTATQTTQTMTQQDGLTDPTYEGTEIESAQFDENGQPIVAASEPGTETEATGDLAGQAGEEATANFLPLPEEMIETTPGSTTALDNDSPAPQSETPAADLQKLLDESLQKFQEKQWESVIELSNQILAIDPSVVTALSNRAVAYTEIGSYALALNDCNLAIEIDPNNPLAINNRGYVYEKMGDIPNAIKDYAMACTLGVDISCKEVERLKQIGS